MLCICLVAFGNEYSGKYEDNQQLFSLSDYDNTLQKDQNVYKEPIHNRYSPEDRRRSS